MLFNHLVKTTGFDIHSRAVEPGSIFGAVARSSRNCEPVFIIRGCRMGEGFCCPARRKNADNTLCIARFFNAAGRQKTRSDGVEWLWIRVLKQFNYNIRFCKDARAVRYSPGMKKDKNELRKRLLRKSPSFAIFHPTNHTGDGQTVHS